MKIPSPTITNTALKIFGLALAFAAVGTVAALGADTHSIDVAGVTLKSVSVRFPSDPRKFTGGETADAINGNCLTCHSAGMVLNQPHLSKAEWEGEVAKMRKVYGAPVADADVPAIVAYLVALSPR